MKKLRVMSVFGTRPEAIKMCPLVKELESRKEDIESIVCLSGQHREMLDQVIDVFGTKADYDLSIMRKKQTLYTIFSDVLQSMEPVLAEAAPDIVLVHGDTSTSFAAALAAYYRQIPVGHVEAGLRTYNIYSPFPEEMNRSLTGRVAELHFAPTQRNKENLFCEGITKNVYVTGNTVIDAFKTTIKEGYEYHRGALRNISGGLNGKRLLLMTAHRRENLGKPLENICKAVRRLVEDNSDTVLIYPVHMNPAVRDTVYRVLGSYNSDGGFSGDGSGGSNSGDGNSSNLGGSGSNSNCGGAGSRGRIHLIDPVDVEDMHNLMSKSYMILTDSGGMQEEAPSCGVPVLVLRTETERPEAVEAGTVKVVGVEEQAIYDSAHALLHDGGLYSTMQRAINPYGDGHASERIADILLGWHAGNTEGSQKGDVGRR